MGMDIKLNKKKSAPSRNPFQNSMPYSKRFGYWAVVTDVNAEKNCVNVLTDMGEEILGVRVASTEWATYTKEPEGKQPELSGERHLPPVGTYVFCLMPTGCYEESFVLCSAFMKSEGAHEYFKQKGKESEWERIENSGWRYVTDYANGTKKITNTPNPDDATICVEINQEKEGEESAKVTVHGNSVTVTKDGIEIATDGKISISVEKDASVEIKGNADVKVTKDATIEAQNVSIKGSAKTEIHGGQVQIAGTVTPKGSGAFCGMPYCAYTGAPQSGDISLNA